MRSRKHKQEEHIDSHRWVVSYADFITLLFAFFVVMYAISSVNVSKYKSLSEGMKSAFNKKDLDKATESTQQKADGPNNKKTKGSYRDGLDELNKALASLQSGDFKISKQDGWIEMDMKAGSMFANGTADLTPEALVKLMQLASKIKDVPYPVVVEGYTDDVPIETPQFPSNWELSAARAATVARVLNSYGISNDRLIVTGYGDQYPVADNSTEEGRSQNRRVDIIIAKNRAVDRLTNPEMGRSHTVMFTSSPTAEPVEVPKIDVKQENTEAKPQNTEAKKQGIEAKPQNIEVKQESTEAKQQSTGTKQ